MQQLIKQFRAALLLALGIFVFALAPAATAQGLRDSAVTVTNNHSVVAKAP